MRKKQKLNDHCERMFINNDRIKSEINVQQKKNFIQKRDKSQNWISNIRWIGQCGGGTEKKRVWQNSKIQRQCQKLERNEKLKKLPPCCESQMEREELERAKVMVIGDGKWKHDNENRHLMMYAGGSE